MKVLAWVAVAGSFGSVGSVSACAPTECASLTDCPGALVCSASGSCVENENPAARAVTTPAPGFTAGNDDDVEVEAQPFWAQGWELTGPTRMLGRVGVLDVDARADVSGSAMQVVASTSDGAQVFVIGAAEGSLLKALTTPGERVYAGDTLDVPVYGVTCAPAYDEPATGGVTVVVSEPDDDGAVTVLITETNSGSAVTVTTGLAPI